MEITGLLKIFNMQSGLVMKELMKISQMNLALQ